MSKFYEYRCPKCGYDSYQSSTPYHNVMCGTQLEQIEVDEVEITQREAWKQCQ